METDAGRRDRDRVGEQPRHRVGQLRTADRRSVGGGRTRRVRPDRRHDVLRRTEQRTGPQSDRDVRRPGRLHPHRFLLPPRTRQQLLRPPAFDERGRIRGRFRHGLSPVLPLGSGIAPAVGLAIVDQHGRQRPAAPRPRCGGKPPTFKARPGRDDRGTGRFARACSVADSKRRGRLLGMRHRDGEAQIRQRLRASGGRFPGTGTGTPRIGRQRVATVAADPIAAVRF